MNRIPALFDVNGTFGRKSTGKSDFPTIRERLDFMNRLAIGRTLVWNEEAKQNHSLACNQKLLDEIAATPGAAGRIIPELVVSGLILYERDGVTELKQQMKAGGTRALRYVNALGVGSLFQIEPVIRALASLQPFVVMKNEEAPLLDILAFTERFPKVPVILTEIIWPRFSKALDLMRQRKNILIDTSWLHTTGAIEIVLEHFGVDRLVFGMGYRSHNGAAIAALARADISAQERERIAHGNLDRLLGWKPGVRVAVAPPAPLADTLWSRCLDRRPLGVEIIDAHFHLGPSTGFVSKEQKEECQVELVLKIMDDLGIRTAMVSGIQAILGDPVHGNDLVERILAPHGERFKGYVGFNPHYADDLIPRFERYFSGSYFVGFKILCGYWGVTIPDPRFGPMWEYANAHRLPVLIHSGSGNYDSPALCHDLVKKYPEVSFIFGHSGLDDAGRRQLEALVPGNPNVFMEWCGSFCSTILWEETLKKVPPSQVLFGSDGIQHDLYWELGRLLSVDVSDEVLTPILGTNMQRILARRR
ncbi:MAG: amidohydrolase family protein [Kiritimatiellae bacterium]|nr:amidohydrolase family protein [Kiritimatiellia bacterium]